MDASPSYHRRPTVVFVPGAFHFTPISDLLRKSSVPTTTVDLPTTARATTATYGDDVYAVRSVLESEILKNGHKVLPAAHSYGGVPACQAVSGLESKKQEAEGKPGGVIHVLFVMALLVERNQRMAEALEGGKAPSWAVFKVSWEISLSFSGRLHTFT